MKATGRGPHPGQSVLSKPALQHLGDELTRLCDGLEKSGLVDYEMGVWEEEIIHCKAASLEILELLLIDQTVLLQCRDIENASNENPGPANTSRGPNPDSGSRQRRP